MYDPSPNLSPKRREALIPPSLRSRSVSFAQRLRQEKRGKGVGGLGLYWTEGGNRYIGYNAGAGSGFAGSDSGSIPFCATSN
ncbi:hypothetical protein NIES4075_39440 [Tolypothrix sp. NIES-4075]|nr:hypothetical protein NIES4075_39440 [Tolypothrix sp. NIES-4075]